jgi:hypothetical protein
MLDSSEYKEIEDIVGIDKKDPATVGLAGMLVIY